MKSIQRNVILEFWRFVFCMAVLAFHFFIRTQWDYFHAGYLGVEFFFLVSGYFIGAYYEKHQKGKKLFARLESVWAYAVSRIRRLYPLYFLALVLMLIVKTVINGWKAKEIVITLKNCLAEFFLLQWTPLGNEVLISAGWFVPAVFFGGIFFVILLALMGRLGGFLVAPLISVSIYAYYFRLIGKIDVIFSFHSVLRSLAGIGFGVFLYFVCECLRGRLEDAKRAGIFCVVCTALSSMLFLSLFIYMNFGRRSKWDFLIIALYGVGLLLLMGAPIKLGGKAGKAFFLLGKMTYPIYTLQMPVIELLFFLWQ